jgi:hypothetical protein
LRRRADPLRQQPAHEIRDAVPSPAELIKAVLDSAGVTHRIQVNPSGHPYAAFAVSTPAGSLPASVIVQGDWLKLTVHRVLPGPARDGDLRLFTRVNVDWLFGRVYFDPKDNHYAAAVGLHVAHGTPRPEAARAAIDQLGVAVQALRAYDIPRFSAAPSSVTMADVKRTLSQLGRPYVESDGDPAVGWGVIAANGSRYSVQVQVASNLLLVRGVHPGDGLLSVDRALLDKIQWVNARLAAGALQFDLDTGRLYYELAFVLAWQPPEAVMQPAIDQTRIVMRHVAEKF